MRSVRGALRHLGVLRGSGMLSCDGQDLGRADFEIDGYATRPGEVVASGEVRMASVALDQVYGRKDLVLTTDDGLALSVRFSPRRRGSPAGTAHADVIGGLPDADNWRR
jgi:hypothetical protein